MELQGFPFHIVKYTKRYSPFDIALTNLYQLPPRPGHKPKTRLPYNLSAPDLDY